MLNAAIEPCHFVVLYRDRIYLIELLLVIKNSRPNQPPTNSLDQTIWNNSRANLNMILYLYSYLSSATAKHSSRTRISSSCFQSCKLPPLHECLRSTDWVSFVNNVSPNETTAPQSSMLRTLFRPSRRWLPLLCPVVVYLLLVTVEKATAIKRQRPFAQFVRLTTKLQFNAAFDADLPIADLSALFHSHTEWSHFTRTFCTWSE